MLQGKPFLGYVEDVLAGYALVYFIGAFINDAFITPEQDEEIVISLCHPTEEEVMVFMDFRWDRSLYFGKIIPQVVVISLGESFRLL